MKERGLGCINRRSMGNLKTDEKIRVGLFTFWSAYTFKEKCRKPALQALKQCIELMHLQDDITYTPLSWWLQTWASSCVPLLSIEDGLLLFTRITKLNMWHPNTSTFCKRSQLLHMPFHRHICADYYTNDPSFIRFRAWKCIWKIRYTENYLYQKLGEESSSLLPFHPFTIHLNPGDLWLMPQAPLIICRNC